MALGKKIAKAIRAKRAAGGGRGRGGMGGALRKVATKIAKGRGKGAGGGGGGAIGRAVRKAGAQKGRAGMIGKAVGTAAGEMKKRKPPRTGGIKPGKPSGPRKQPPVRRPREEGRSRKRARPAPMPDFGGIYRTPKPVRTREEAYRTTKSRFMGRDGGGSDR